MIKILSRRIIFLSIEKDLVITLCIEDVLNNDEFTRATGVVVLYATWLMGDVIIIIISYGNSRKARDGNATIPVTLISQRVTHVSNPEASFWLFDLRGKRSHAPSDGFSMVVDRIKYPIPVGFSTLLHTISRSSTHPAPH